MKPVSSIKRHIFTMAVGIVILAVDFIVFAVVIEGAEATRLAPNVTEFTGMGALITIGPTLAFVGFLVAGLIPFFLGVRGIVRHQRGK